MRILTFGGTRCRRNLRSQRRVPGDQSPPAESGGSPGYSARAGYALRGQPAVASGGDVHDAVSADDLAWGEGHGDAGAQLPGVVGDPGEGLFVCTLTWNPVSCSPREGFIDRLSLLLYGPQGARELANLG